MYVYACLSVKHTFAKSATKTKCHYTTSVRIITDLDMQAVIIFMIRHACNHIIGNCQKQYIEGSDGIASAILVAVEGGNQLYIHHHGSPNMSVKLELLKHLLCMIWNIFSLW